MNKIFNHKSLSKEISDLKKHITDTESLIIVIDVEDYKILRSDLVSTSLVNTLIDSPKIKAKDDFLVDEEGDPIWVSNNGSNENVYLKDLKTENLVRQFLVENNLTKEEVSTLLTYIN